MSFRLFIYYCALGGGWAAFAVWAVVELAALDRLHRVVVQTAVIAGLLGGLIAAAVAVIDGLTKPHLAARTVTAAALGVAGGATGGIVGQMLHLHLRVPLVVGWMLSGVLIGVAIGAFDVLQMLAAGIDSLGARRKLRNGVLGGLLGGLVGGLPYTFLRESPQLPTSGRTISLVLLGTCIGLMIGLAQVILKEAWLSVVEGHRPGRELLLTRPHTTLGRAEACDLGLYGDPAVGKIHARIERRGTGYVLVHLADEGETRVNEQPVGAAGVPLRSGDAIRIGRSLIRFRERATSNGS